MFGFLKNVTRDNRLSLSEPINRLSYTQCFLTSDLSTRKGSIVWGDATYSTPTTVEISFLGSQGLVDLANDDTAMGHVSLTDAIRLLSAWVLYGTLPTVEDLEVSQN